MTISSATVDRVCKAVQRDRLVQTALRLIDVPSRTGEAGAGRIAWPKC